MQETSNHEKELLDGRFERLHDELQRVSEDAIHDTASAYRNISRQLEITEELGGKWTGNLENAQTETRLAMVDLVSVAAEDDFDRTKQMLDEYGFGFLE